MRKYIFPLILTAAGIAGCASKDADMNKYFGSPRNPLIGLYSKHPGMQSALEKQMHELDLNITNKLDSDVDSLFTQDSDVVYTPELMDMIGNYLKKIESETDSLFHLSKEEGQYLKKCLDDEYINMQE